MSIIIKTNLFLRVQRSLSIVKEWSFIKFRTINIQ